MPDTKDHMKKASPGCRASCAWLGAWLEPAVASDRVVDALGTRPDWFPADGIALAYRLSTVLRSLRDEDGGNRWLHHRWLRLFDEVFDARLPDYLTVLAARGFDNRVTDRTVLQDYRLDRAALRPRFAHDRDEDPLCSRAVIVSRTRASS